MKRILLRDSLTTPELVKTRASLPDDTISASLHAHEFPSKHLEIRLGTGVLVGKPDSGGWWSPEVCQAGEEGQWD